MILIFALRSCRRPFFQVCQSVFFIVVVLQTNRNKTDQVYFFIMIFFGAGRCPIHCRGNKMYCLSITAGCQIIHNATLPWSPQEIHLFYLIVFDCEFRSGAEAARVIHGIFVEAKANGLLGQCLRVRSEGAIYRRYLEWKKV